MNANELWKKNVLEAVNDIADEDIQRKLWLADGDLISSPEEAYCSLIGDNVFQEFLNEPMNNLSESQKECGNALIKELDEYFYNLPKFPDPNDVISDPKWNNIRQIAKEFLQLFH